MFCEKKMRKLFVSMLAALMAVIWLSGCGSAVKVGAFKSLIYNNDEFQDAVNVTLDYFKNNFEGCTMSEIHYAGDDTVYKEAEYIGRAPEMVMVLETTFKTDGENRENGLEPNFEYKSYKWILTRDFREGMWEHKDHGYN